MLKKKEKKNYFYVPLFKGIKTQKNETYPDCKPDFLTLNINSNENSLLFFIALSAIAIFFLQGKKGIFKRGSDSRVNKVFDFFLYFPLKDRLVTRNHFVLSAVSSNTSFSEVVPFYP